MSELASLEKSLLDLLSKLNSKICPIILGGGYGLYLRRTVLEREGTRTLLEHWPEARSTNDLDLFLRPELLCDSTRLALLKSALDELGYTPVEGAEHYQFRKDDPAGFIERGIKIDLLTGPRSRFAETGLKVDARRVRPNPSVKVHAHPTDEAITLEDHLQEVKLQLAEDSGESKSVFLPHPFTYSLMKLFAFRDQADIEQKGFGSHHALDLYSIIAMMNEPQWEQAKAMAVEHSNSAILGEASRITKEMFGSMTGRGLLIMRRNPYCSDRLQLSDFVELIKEVFALVHPKAGHSPMNESTFDISLNFQHSYADQLPDFVAAVQPAQVPSPSLLQFNQSLAEELGLDLESLTADAAKRIFSGNELPKDARPVAQAYAGHQFGGFVPQLGDGRALLLGEVIDRQGVRRDIALKGSGKTPFSRGGDGKAAVGPVLREYLIGEAMHALGIPTTRALAAVATGETVMRERPLPGAVLTRVAASHVRVGTFQYFAARRDIEQVQKLADYVIGRHYPEITTDSGEDSQPYLSLLRAVVERQADLIARWMLVGFIHGVMNTDNMAICGETIDYGPCAFMDTYNPQTVFSSIDRNGRYAYVNQPSIALWNLARFADTLLPLIDAEDTDRAVAKAMEILGTFMPTFEQNWYQGALTKLGLADADNPERNSESVSDSDRKLINDWLELLSKNKVDFTLAWRRLTDVAEDNPNELGDLFTDPAELDAWLERWKKLHDGTESSTLASKIRAANPIYIPRNHLVEEALNAASDNGDLKLFEKLLEVVQHPYEENPEFDRYALPAPAEFTACYQTFCGT